MSDDECTCQHYVVDYSDPEPLHPENVDRELNPECPEHGEILEMEPCETCGHEAHVSGPCRCGCDD